LSDQIVTITFQKLDNCAFVIFHGKFTDEGNIIDLRPIFIIHLRYVRESLILTELSGTFSYSENDEDIIFAASLGRYKVRSFLVRPVDTDKEKPLKAPADLSFNTGVVGVGYSLVTKNNSMYNPGFFTLGTEASVTYRQDKNIRVLVKRRIWNRIIQTSKQQYPFIR